MSLERLIQGILTQWDVSLNDENFADTPRRAASWLNDYAPMSAEEEASFIERTLTPVFPEAHSELVAVTGIRFSSLCAHHLLPFRGVAHVGYIPQNGVVGISKLARLVKGLAKQATLQEKITRTVADAIYKTLQCEGVIVVLRADHLCMQMRGVEDDNTQTVTSAVRGCFRTNSEGCKDEFLELIKR